MRLNGARLNCIITQFTKISNRVSRNLATRCPILASSMELRALSPSEGGMSSGQISAYTHIKQTNAVHGRSATCHAVLSLISP